MTQDYTITRLDWIFTPYNRYKLDHVIQDERFVTKNIESDFKPKNSLFEQIH